MTALSSTDIQGQFESFNAKDYPDYPSIDGEISHFIKVMMHAAGNVKEKMEKHHKKQTVVWQYMQTVKETIDLVTVFDAISTSRQTLEKLQCLYENLKSNDFRKTAVLKKLWLVNLSYTTKEFTN